MRLCAWPYNHSGEAEIPLATNICTLPGATDGGRDWFGGPEPNTRLPLCNSCTDIFVAQNGGPEKVIVEAIAIALPSENPFSPPRREVIPS